MTLILIILPLQNVSTPVFILFLLLLNLPRYVSSFGRSRRTLRFHCSIPCSKRLPSPRWWVSTCHEPSVSESKKSLVLPWLRHETSWNTIRKHETSWNHIKSTTVKDQNEHITEVRGWAGVEITVESAVCLFIFPSRTIPYYLDTISKTWFFCTTLARTGQAILFAQATRLSSLSLRSFHPPPLPISPSLARSLSDRRDTVDDVGNREIFER